ncbi:hypothetical protein [uncultured Fibrobacter sp.]|uniref:hypothetical protein n=1 Tax=uncultured Fibrobacter sp. TaxID=261512 RepID=UPI002605C100|nr:hypothetical protein [uncultured Fibrobacter sp.]
MNFDISTKNNPSLDERDYFVSAGARTRTWNCFKTGRAYARPLAFSARLRRAAPAHEGSGSVPGTSVIFLDCE